MNKNKKSKPNELELKDKHSRNRLRRIQELKEDRWYPWKNEEEYHQKDMGENADYLLGLYEDNNT